jgi:hypothetical protein
MISMFKRLVAICLGMLLVVAMAGPVMAGNVVKHKEVIDTTGIVFDAPNPVTGGFITLSGDLTIREHMVFDKNGQLKKYSHHVHGLLSGVDSVSGEVYKIPFNDNYTAITKNNVCHEVNIVRLISKGSSYNVFLKYHLQQVGSKLLFEVVKIEVR